MRKTIIFTVSCAACSAGLAQTYDETLKDARDDSADAIEWSALGKVNWSPWAGSPWKTHYDNAGSNSIFNENGAGFSPAPSHSPYGDALAYIAGGVGDVDGDGYGDFGLSWYHAEAAFPNGSHRDGIGHHTHEAQNFTELEDVGFVRIMSGDPNFNSFAGPLADRTSDYDVSNDNHTMPNADFDYSDRQIGHEFWGRVDFAIWAHEIATIGDINGDGKDDVLLTANNTVSPLSSSMSGVAEIWSYTNLYNLDVENSHSHDSAYDPAMPRWVKLIEITGRKDYSEYGSSGRISLSEEIAYQAYSGPLPDDSDGSNGYQPGATTGFDIDFNNDGQPDLILASKFFADASLGHPTGLISNPPSLRNTHSPGAAWIYLLPKAEVFEEIADLVAAANQSGEVELALPDCVENHTRVSGGDALPDMLPLTWDSTEYSVRITGHQFAEIDPTNYAIQQGIHARHFGYQIDPAGDVDNDGRMDFCVSAPFHYKHEAWESFINDEGPMPSIDDLVGQVYIFLSDSVSGQRSNDTRAIADLSPKYFVTPPNVLVYDNSYCGSTYASHISELSMLSNQMDFTSADADFILQGSSPSTTALPGFGTNLEAGIELSDKNNPDPDLAILDFSGADIYIFENLSSQIGSITGPSVNWPVVVWDSSSYLSGTSHLALAATASKWTDPFGNVSSTASHHHLNLLRDHDLKGPTFLGMVGDQDGDGDCELGISCHRGDAGDANTGAVILNYTSQNGLDIARVYQPETPSDPALASVPGPSPFDDYVRDHTLFRLWPIWHSSRAGSSEDALDDTLIGCRSFPRRVVDYWIENALDGSYSIGTQDFNTSAPGYDNNTIVTAGKMWLVRTPVSQSLDE